MIDAWTIIDPAVRARSRSRPQVRRCADMGCRHRLLPVHEHCPACGTRWEPSADGGREAGWERPAFLASMTIIGSITVVPVAIAGLVVLAAIGAAIF